MLFHAISAHPDNKVAGAVASADAALLGDAGRLAARLRAAKQTAEGEHALAKAQVSSDGALEVFCLMTRVSAGWCGGNWTMFSKFCCKFHFFFL